MQVLAYKLAISNKVQDIPHSWNVNEKAGIDWTRGFLDRHKEISLRTPESTSVQRMVNCNEVTVKMFFENLEQVLRRDRGFSADQIWNVDETGITTVQRPSKILAKKGLKQVSSAVSQERGTLVTVCCVINALGSHIPPFLYFQESMCRKIGY